MKALYYSLFILAGVLLTDTVLELSSGHAVVSAPSGGSAQEAYRDMNPQEYQRLMKYQWARAGLAALAGFIALTFKRRQDRTDPFSPHFEGQQSIDELTAHLDNKKHNNP